MVNTEVFSTPFNIGP